MSRLVRFYPMTWRRRYEAEMLQLLDKRPRTPREALDLIRGAIDAHLHPELVSDARMLMARQSPLSVARCLAHRRRRGARRRPLNCNAGSARRAVERIVDGHEDRCQPVRGVAQPALLVVLRVHAAVGAGDVHPVRPRLGGGNAIWASPTRTRSGWSG